MSLVPNLQYGLMTVFTSESFYDDRGVTVKPLEESLVQGRISSGICYCHSIRWWRPFRRLQPSDFILGLLLRLGGGNRGRSGGKGRAQESALGLGKLPGYGWLGLGGRGFGERLYARDGVVLLLFTGRDPDLMGSASLLL